MQSASVRAGQLQRRVLLVLDLEAPLERAERLARLEHHRDGLEVAQDVALALARHRDVRRVVHLRRHRDAALRRGADRPRRARLVLPALRALIPFGAVEGVVLEPHELVHPLLRRGVLDRQVRRRVVLGIDRLAAHLLGDGLAVADVLRLELVRVGLELDVDAGRRLRRGLSVHTISPLASVFLPGIGAGSATAGSVGFFATGGEPPTSAGGAPSPAGSACSATGGKAAAISALSAGSSVVARYAVTWSASPGLAVPSPAARRRCRRAGRGRRPGRPPRRRARRPGHARASARRRRCLRCAASR